VDRRTQDGKGTLSTDSGTLKQTQYSFSTRFENGVGTNPKAGYWAHADVYQYSLCATQRRDCAKLETTATIIGPKSVKVFITKSISTSSPTFLA
jgi:hypothetical protein